MSSCFFKSLMPFLCLASISNGQDQGVLTKNEYFSSNHDIETFLATKEFPIDMNYKAFQFEENASIVMRNINIPYGSALFLKNGVVHNYGKIIAAAEIFKKSENIYNLGVKGLIFHATPRNYAVYHDVSDFGFFNPPGKFYLFDKQTHTSQQNLYQDILNSSSSDIQKQALTDKTGTVYVFDSIDEISDFISSIAVSGVWDNLQGFTSASFSINNQNYVITGDVDLFLYNDNNNAITLSLKQDNSLSTLYINHNNTDETYDNTNIEAAAEYLQNIMLGDFFVFEDRKSKYFEGYPGYYVYDLDEIDDIENIDEMSDYYQHFLLDSSTPKRFDTEEEAQEQADILNAVEDPRINIANPSYIEFDNNIWHSINRVLTTSFINSIDMTYRLDSALAKKDILNMHFQSIKSISIRPVEHIEPMFSGSDVSVFSCFLNFQIKCDQTIDEETIAPTLEIGPSVNGKPLVVIIKCPDELSNREAEFPQITIHENCTLKIQGEHSILGDQETFDQRLTILPGGKYILENESGIIENFQSIQNSVPYIKPPKWFFRI